MITVTDKDLFESYCSEIREKASAVNDWSKEKGYPHSYYDYSTDDSDDFEYRQDEM